VSRAGERKPRDVHAIAQSTSVGQTDAANPVAAVTAVKFVSGGTGEVLTGNSRLGDV
jgi:hypothetical protein